MKTKNISRLLLTGVILNSLNLNSFASILSEDGRYETFEGNNITIDNILEEDEVDVEIEGNTMVNVANQKAPVPITKSYTVEGANHIPLQGEYDGKARPVIEGNTMYYNNDTGELLDTFVEGANLSLISSFEDQLVTQEMVDNGEEKAENLGKYKIEYKVTGKNKFNSVNIQNNKYQNCNTETLNFTIVDNTDYSITGFIPVKPNTNYKISGSFESGAYYDNNKIPIKTAGGISGTDDIFTPNECYYIVLNAKWGTHDLSTLQIEEGSTATEYEPYKESIKTFYLNSPLLEGDTIEEIDGKATHIRRSEKIVLDGSEDWAKGNVYGDSHQFVISRPSNMKSESAVMSNSLKSQHNVSEIGTCYSGTLYFNVFMPETTTIEYKQWLSENPMTVVYELAEPIYEIISEESILIDSYVDGHLNLNTSIPVNKVDFKSTTTNLNYLYPSTEYTIQFESDNKGKINNTLLCSEVLYSDYIVNKGINRLNITTPNNITSTELILDGVGFNLSNLVVTDGIKEDFDYFEGIKSVGQDDENGHKLEIISSNNQIPKTNTLYKEHGIEINFASYAIKENLYAYNLSDKIITVHTVKDGVHSRMFLVNPNSTIFINLNDGESIYCFAGLYIDGWNNNNTELLKKSLILTKDENSFKKIEISLTEPLRSLPNGVKDRIIKRNGQWVVERNCGELSTEMLYNAKWNLHTKDNNSMNHFGAVFNNVNGKIVQDINLYSNAMASGYWASQVPYTICTSSTIAFQIGINVEKGTYTEDRLKKYIKENNMRIVYQLATPIYEPLHINSTINTYLDITHISNNSNISANMKVTVDRTINRATEAIELAKTNPTVANISKARMWTNLLKESIKKDELQSEINSITNIEDLQLERKTATSNVDVYIKSENMLLMSLSTNSITFEDYSGVEDMELNNAINISINSSLPYQLNSYLLSEIENSDKSNRIEKNLLNIKTNDDTNYKTFNDINEKLVLEYDCDAGNNKSHSIDLRLKGSQAHKADIYKTVIKFEAEQK